MCNSGGLEAGGRQRPRGRARARALARVYHGVVADERVEAPRSPDDVNTETAHPQNLAAPKRDRPYLIVLAGTAMGAMHLIDKEVTVVGRGDKADLRIIDDGISREHTRILFKNGKIELEDLGSTNGTFCNGLRVRRQGLSEGDKILIGASTILKFTYHDQLDEVFQQQLTESALRDPLTKVYNRRFFLDRIQNEFQYAERHRTPVTLVFLDIDRFKSINDTFGHPGGDEVLQQMATLLVGTLRGDDVLCRYGGEEFAVICRGLDLDKGEAMAERLRKRVADHPFQVQGKPLPVTISIGVARVPDPRLRTPPALIAAADETMYQAKRAGRNRVRVQAPPDEDEEASTGEY